MHEYDKLNRNESKMIERYVILQKRVSEFVKDCDIPFSAYYNALYGRRIKKEHKEVILKQLEIYSND